MSKGWNVSNENLKEIYDFIDSFKPQNEIDERNKYILHLAFVENKSALSIANMQDRKIVSYGNRSKGKPLTNVQVSRIINSYNLIREKKHDYSARNSYNRRRILRNKVQKGEINKPKICGCCGDTEKLELHHIVPIEIGGSDEYYNLIYLCHECHVKIHRNILDALKCGDAL